LSRIAVVIWREKDKIWQKNHFTANWKKQDEFYTKRLLKTLAYFCCGVLYFISFRKNSKLYREIKQTLILPLHPLLLFLHNVRQSYFFFFRPSVGQTYSLPSFGLCVGLCDLTVCMTVKGWHTKSSYTFHSEGTAGQVL